MIFNEIWYFNFILSFPFKKVEIWWKFYKKSNFIMPQIFLTVDLVVYLLFFSLKWNEITIMKKNKEKALLRLLFDENHWISNAKKYFSPFPK